MGRSKDKGVGYGVLGLGSGVQGFGVRKVLDSHLFAVRLRTDGARVSFLDSHISESRCGAPNS